MSEIDLLFGDTKRVTDWVSDKTGVHDFGPEPTAIGILQDGILIAGAVYHTFRSGNIDLTFAAQDDRWRTPKVLRALFYYPFVQAKCCRLTCIVPATDEVAQRVCIELGFVQEARCRQVFGPIDGIVFGMLSEECQWIR